MRRHNQETGSASRWYAGTAGLVVATIWDFGDDGHSADPAPVHVYAEPGTCLISCMVIDDCGVSITDWRHYEIHAGADLPDVIEPGCEEEREESSCRRAGRKTVGVLTP